ncbi:hypothetical protein KP509_1Z264000 [Ceratopteris richardii]|nr:hypothetical protein KP509_1Z264000 [Ceratopteris richardii]
MTLSIGSPAFATDITENPDLIVKLPNKPSAQRTWWDIQSSSTGSNLGKGTTDAISETERSGLSFENDIVIGGRDLGLFSAKSIPYDIDFSARTRDKLSLDKSEKAPPMSLCLGLTGGKSHSSEHGCVDRSFMSGGIPIPAKTHEFRSLTEEGKSADNYLRSIPSDIHYFRNNAKDGTSKCLNFTNEKAIGRDLGMQLQLSLSSSSTVVSDDDHVSYMPSGQEKASTYHDANKGNISTEIYSNERDSTDMFELNLIADDEGSTSARTVKVGGYIPSLLMGRRLDGVSFGQRKEEEQLSARKRSLVHQVQNEQNSLDSDRAPKTCKFLGCSKGARGASGLCITHGGGRRCQRPGCHKGAEGRTVYCKSHGGGKRCLSLGCTKSAEGKTEYCIGHGGGRRCSQDGCTKAARGRSGLCIRHGGGKRCQIEGCTKSAEGYSGLCISHGGGRRCQAEGCSKGAQGSTRFCKAHGGGKRCMIQGCTKGAEGSTPLCKGHGGGKRCMFDGGGICTKSVHGGTSFCVAHGGGKRCGAEGHGGGKRCKFDNCSKSAQGSTDFCKAHGGGKRCCWGQEGSPYAEYVGDNTDELLKGPCERFARGKIGLCAAHTALVQDQRVHGVGTLGSALPAGIGPGLFRGLVTGATSKTNQEISVSESCKTSFERNEDQGKDCESRPMHYTTVEAKYGVAAFDEGNQSATQGNEDYNLGNEGLNSSRGVRDNAWPSKNHVPLVNKKLQHAHVFSEAFASQNAESRWIQNNVIISNQVQSSNLMSKGFVIPNLGVQGRWAGASEAIQCEANNTISSKAVGFANPNSLCGVHAMRDSAMGNQMLLGGRPVRRALLPPQVLVPPSMQTRQCLPGYGKHTRVSIAVETDITNTALLSMGEDVHSGEERVHGGSILALLTGTGSKDISY